MRYAWTVVLAVTVAVHGQTPLAQNTPVDQVREQAVELRSIDPLDEDFSDLAPLKRILEGRRVVVLGEADHGGGSVFLAKIRLIKFLHEQMGFNVLAWEDGMYDARLTSQHLAAGDPPRQAAMLGVIPIWSFSAQTDVLWRYLAQTAKTDHPLQLVGFDTHVGATGRPQEVQSALVGDLKRLNRLLPGPRLPDEALDGIQPLWDEKVRTPETVQRTIRILESLRARLLRPEPNQALGPREAMWWRQCLATFIHKVRDVTLPAGDQGPMAPLFNPRDEQSGRNLLWYATAYEPDAKIIVWCATMHAIRDPESIDPLAAPVDYTDVMPMGYYAWLGLGRQLYVLGFVANEGITQLPWGFARRTLEPAPVGSLEAVANQAALKHAWIDLSGAPDGSWLRDEIVARPLGYVPMKARWQDHLDGFFFIDAVEPSERAPETQKR